MTTRIILKTGDTYIADGTIEDIERHLTTGAPIQVRWWEVGGQEWSARIKIKNEEDIIMLREDTDENLESIIKEG